MGPTAQKQSDGSDVAFFTVIDKIRDDNSKVVDFYDDLGEKYNTTFTMMGYDSTTVYLAELMKKHLGKQLFYSIFIPYFILHKKAHDIFICLFFF